jgi:predicted Zn-dependent peptidase
MGPAFDEEKLEETKTRLASSVSRRNDEPAPINSREFNKLIYGETSPFAAVLEYEHLDNITGADIARNYKMFFAPDNMLVGVTGPVDMDEVKEIFEKYLGNWGHRARIPSYPQVREQTHDFKVAFAEKSNLTQSYLSIGHLGTIEDFDEEAKIMVFNSIFSRGFKSRLVTRVRTKMGLTYGIGGGIVTQYLYPGKTYVSTFTKSESTFKAVRAILDEIDIIRKEKVTEKELKDAKDYFVNSFVFKYSTPERIIYQELQKEFYDLIEGYSEKLLENIKRVTADDVLEMAQKYLHPDKMIVFILGKEEKLDGKLEELGKVKKIDISIKPPPVKEKIPEPTPETLKKGTDMIMALGQEKYSGYKRIKSLETTGDMKMTMMGQTMSMAVKSVTLYPDKRYAEFSVMGMGMKIERIINGNKGLMKQTGQERPIPGKDIEKEKFGSLYDIFHSKDKYQFQYLWEKEIDGKKYDVIYIFDAQKNWKKFFINKETGFIEVEEKLTRLPGQAGVEREIKSDFKIIKGIPFAFKSETFVKDKKVVEVTVKEVKVNPKVDLSLFKIEEKK